MGGNDFKCDKCQKETYVMIIFSWHKFPKHESKSNAYALFPPKPNIIFGSYKMGWTMDRGMVDKLADNTNVVHNNMVPDNTKDNISVQNVCSCE